MKKFSLPKTSLLRKTWEYDRVYRLGKRLRGHNFTLICAPNDQAGNRCGISIHGRLKGAVRRNRIKRTIKEFYRLHREFMQPPQDVIFAVRQGFDLKNPVEVERAVRVLLDKNRKSHPVH